jgi:tetratricopeptide (TPR) repeat protein
MVSAYAYLAVSYAFMAQSGQMDANQAAEIATGYASKAMEIDPDDSTSLVALAFVKLYSWQWEEGRRLLDKAIEINPNDANARMAAAEYAFLFLEDDKVIESAKLMCQLDPLSANTVGQAARYFMFLGRFEEAIALADEALALDTHSLVSRNIKAGATGFNGDWENALKQIQETHKIAGDYPFVLMEMGIIYSKLGEIDKANEIIAKFETMMQENPNANLDFAIGFVAIYSGNLEKFYEAYDRGLEKKSVILLQCYGTEMMKPVWYDEHVIESRKKFGLAVKS